MKGKLLIVVLKQGIAAGRGKPEFPVALAGRDGDAIVGNFTRRQSVGGRAADERQVENGD